MNIPQDKQHKVEEPEWLTKAAQLKQSVLERLAAMPLDQRDSPTSTSWSASAIIEHLILVEENVAGLWRENLKGVPGAKAGLGSEIPNRIVSFIFSKTMMRVPTVPELEPVGGLALEELERRWNVAREKLCAALPEDANAAWIFHPAFGPLSSRQMGRLLVAHLEHHLRHWPTVK